MNADAILEAAEQEADAAAHYERLIREQVEAHPDLPDWDLAEMVVDSLPEQYFRALLIRQTRNSVYVEKRCQARQVEKEARAAGPRTGGQRGRQPVVQTPVAPVEDPKPANQFEALYADPKVWAKGTWFNSRERGYFRTWCNRRDGRGAFDAWLNRALEQGVDEGFKLDFVEGYSSQMHFSAISEAINKFAEQVRFEVTAELLDSIFATGDGTRVTWREATLEQHEERIEMLTKSMVGTAETAAMHQRAVQMIKAAGVQTLGQVAV